MLSTSFPMSPKGIDIVGCEPSCLLSLRDEYPDLVPGPEAKVVAGQALLFEEFFQQNGLEFEFPSPPEEVLVHGHCHQKALVGHGAHGLLAREDGSLGEGGRLGLLRHGGRLRLRVGALRYIASDGGTETVARSSRCVT